MQKTGADFTNCFRLLSSMPLTKAEDEKTKNIESLKAQLLEQCCSIEELRLANQPRMDARSVFFLIMSGKVSKGTLMHFRQMQMLLTMLEMNPGLLAQMGMAARGLMQDLARLEKLKELRVRGHATLMNCITEYSFQEKTEEWKSSQDSELWSAWLQKYSERLKKEAASCTSLDEANADRTKTMNAHNPK
jgi:hypothetical protein